LGIHDIHSLKIRAFEKTLEAVVRDPTATSPRPTLGSRPPGWEPLVYTLCLTRSPNIYSKQRAFW